MRQWNSTGVRCSQATFRIRRLTFPLALAIVLGISATARIDQPASLSAQSPNVAATEFDLKLVRIYATAKFTTWPDESSKTVTPFIIGIVDPDPFQGRMQTLEQRKKLKDRPIRVVYMKTERDYQDCHLLFIPNETNPVVAKEIIKRTADRPILVWRDRADPNDPAGVACTFLREGEKLLIEADPAEFKRRNLAPDGQLLSLNLVRMVKPVKSAGQ